MRRDVGQRRRRMFTRLRALGRCSRPLHRLGQRVGSVLPCGSFSRCCTGPVASELMRVLSDGSDCRHLLECRSFRFITRVPPLDHRLGEGRRNPPCSLGLNFARCRAPAPRCCFWSSPTGRWVACRQECRRPSAARIGETEAERGGLGVLGRPVSFHWVTCRPSSPSAPDEWRSRPAAFMLGHLGLVDQDGFFWGRCRAAMKPSRELSGWLGQVGGVLPDGDGVRSTMQKIGSDTRSCSLNEAA